MIKLLFVLLRWLGVDVLEERKRSLHLIGTVVPENVRHISKTLLPWIKDFSEVDQSNDWKRKEVYALGIKAFPDMPKHIIAYALEYAIWKSR